MEVLEKGQFLNANTENTVIAVENSEFWENIRFDWFLQTVLVLFGCFGLSAVLSDNQNLAITKYCLEVMFSSLLSLFTGALMSILVFWISFLCIYQCMFVVGLISHKEREFALFF